MRFSLRWLRNYLQTDLPPQRLIEAITECGLEVEQVLDLGMISGKLVVGEILKIEAIPGAEKIRLTTVMADEREPLRIVCGAQNIKEGDRVPVAKFGMKFPDGFELKPKKIMGIEGQGMLCSAKELGVAEDAAGIWILPADAPVAEPWDALVEISITPNRPDALSILGVARDLAARLTAKGQKASLSYPDVAVTESADKAEGAARVVVTAKEDCPRYTARVVKGLKVAPSPRWMQIVLESAGLRPINNLVDVTNYVLLELGHPLHAFDLDRLNGSTIHVRTANAGEKITTLDGQEQKLEPTDLLICDAAGPVALAGIMGGANSEIGDGTTNVLLESAYFRPQTIRRTSKRLDKATDASYRFERGTDPQRLTAALNRAAQLMAQLGGGTVLKGTLDVASRLPEKDPVVLRLGRLCRLLGYEVSGREVINVLTPLGFEVLRSDREEIQVAIPSYRPDVALEADVMEEVARILGYDRIPEKPLTLPSVWKSPSPLEETREKLATAAVGLGFSQAVNFSFISEAGNALVGLGDGRQVRVLNPIVAEQGVMRRSLLPSLLQNVAHNLNHGVEDVALFELGHAYEFAEEKEEPREPKDIRPPAVETPFFAAVIAGGGKRNWRDAATEVDFFAMKGAVEGLLQALGLTKLVVEEAPGIRFLHPGRSARFLVKGHVVASFGEVHPAVLKEMDVKKRVCYVEIPLVGTVLEGAGRDRFRELPRFPAVTRDVALLVDRGVRSLDLERTIRKAGKELLAGVRLFDVYEGQHVEPGKKSLAYSLVYRAADRTLKETEVNEVHEAIVAALAKEHSATLRA